MCLRPHAASLNTRSERPKAQGKQLDALRAALAHVFHLQHALIATSSLTRTKKLGFDIFIYILLPTKCKGSFLVTSSKNAPSSNARSYVRSDALCSE